MTTVEKRLLAAIKNAAIDLKLVIKNRRETEVLDEKLKTMYMLLEILGNSDYNQLMNVCWEVLVGNEYIEQVETELLEEIYKLREML